MKSFPNSPCDEEGTDATAQLIKNKRYLVVGAELRAQPASNALK
jgi:hypothetical protein